MAVAGSFLSVFLACITLNVFVTLFVSVISLANGFKILFFIIRTAVGNFVHAGRLRILTK